VASPRVAVCIANWNCRDRLRDCLRSLLHQTQGVPFEVVVVDNASTDGAPSMVAREFPSVTLIGNATNRGFSAASNQAAAASRADILLFLNNDTIAPPGTLAALVDVFAEYPTAGMIGPRLVGGTGYDQISYRRRPTLGALLHRIALLRWTGFFRKAYYDYRRDDFHPHGTREVEVLMGAAVALPRDVFEKAGRWDESFRFGVEDIDLSAQVRRIAPVLFCGDIRITHFGREASRLNAGFTASNVIIGYVKHFRKEGVSAAVLTLYKALVTLDAPLQWLGKRIQARWRQWRGHTRGAAKSRLAADGLAYFLTRDLSRFWRA
jgi:hypothetical protein